MTTKNKACTLTPKHKWTWVKNVVQQSITYSAVGNSARMSLKGLYKCECGERKLGTANHRGEDLREIIDGEAK